MNCLLRLTANQPITRAVTTRTYEFTTILPTVGAVRMGQEVVKGESNHNVVHFVS